MEKTRKLLILSFFLLSLGGFLLHSRIHPVWVKEITDLEAHFEFEHFLANLGSFLSFTLVSLLFLYRKTASTAQALNGMLVILGTILMAHFSWETMERPLTLISLILKSTLADIIILWGNFFVGQVIFLSYRDTADERR